MFAKRCSVLLPALAFAGLLVPVTPAAAWHGATFRQRTVVRGNGWGPGVAVWPGAPLGVPGVGLTGGVHSQALLLGTASPFASQAFLLGGTSPFLPQSYFLGGLPIDQGGGRQQADKRSGDSTGNTPPAGTVPTPAAPSAACAELAQRLDKIDGRLDVLTADVARIEAKVDFLLAERQQQKMQAQMEAFRKQLRKDALMDADKLIQANNKNLAVIAREVLKAAPAEREKKLDELLKKIEAGQ